MTFDIFVPSLSLALEYQGVQHYEQYITANADSLQVRQVLYLSSFSNDRSGWTKKNDRRARKMGLLS